MAAFPAILGEDPSNLADKTDACHTHQSSLGFKTSPSLCRPPLPAASRMIANSLSRDSPPATPLRPRPHTSKISVTVSNKLASAKAGREGDRSQQKQLLFPFCSMLNPHSQILTAALDLALGFLS